MLTGRSLLGVSCGKQHELERLPRRDGTLRRERPVRIPVDHAVPGQIHDIIVIPVSGQNVAEGPARVDRPVPQRTHGGAAGNDAVLRKRLSGSGLQPGKGIAELIHCRKRAVAFADLVHREIGGVRRAVLALDDEIGELRFRRLKRAVQIERRLLQPSPGKSLLRVAADMTPYAERLRHLEACRALLSAHDLHKVARSRQPARAEIVGKADQRVELPLRRLDVIAEEKFIEFRLISQDLFVQKVLRLLLRNTVRIVVLAALRAVADVPLAAGCVLLCAEPLVLFELGKSRLAGRPVAVCQRGHTHGQRKAQCQQQGKVSFCLHDILSFAGFVSLRFYPTISLHNYQPSNKNFRILPKTAKSG